ncbi:hypothetical protein Dimus_017091 [Dionaea muscipula]
MTPPPPSTPPAHAFFDCTLQLLSRAVLLGHSKASSAPHPHPASFTLLAYSCTTAASSLLLLALFWFLSPHLIIVSLLIKQLPCLLLIFPYSALSIVLVAFDLS